MSFYRPKAADDIDDLKTVDISKPYQRIEISQCEHPIIMMRKLFADIRTELEYLQQKVAKLEEELYGTKRDD